MFVTTVLVTVKPEHITNFIEACTINHDASRKEPGNQRFDILQNSDDPARFLLYEGYDSIEFAAAHKKTIHYKVWRETVAPMMAEPRKGITYKTIRPL